MARSTSKDAQDLFRTLLSAYSATPTNLRIIDLYVMFAVFTALIQVVYMALVGSFPFNSFLSGVLSCIGTAVLAVCLRIQVNKENKEFKDLAPERAFADFVLCNLETPRYFNCINDHNNGKATFEWSESVPVKELPKSRKTTIPPKRKSAHAHT